MKIIKIFFILFNLCQGNNSKDYKDYKDYNNKEKEKEKVIQTEFNLNYYNKNMKLKKNLILFKEEKCQNEINNFNKIKDDEILKDNEDRIKRNKNKNKKILIQEQEQLFQERRKELEQQQQQYQEEHQPHQEEQEHQQYHQEQHQHQEEQEDNEDNQPIMLIMSEEFSNKYNYDNNNNTYNDCIAVCLLKGTSIEFITNILPIYIYTINDNFNNWYNLCNVIELGILSEYPNNLIVYTLDDKTNERIDSYTLESYNLIWSNVPICSKHEIVDPKQNGLILKSITSCHTEMIVIKDNISTKKHTSHILPINIINSNINLHWSESQSIQRTYTTYGFEKVKLPYEIWNSISSYYYNNHKSVSNDYSQYYNYYTVNWWNTTSIQYEKIQIPPILSNYWSQLIQYYIESWLNDGPINDEDYNLKLTSSNLNELRIYYGDSYQIPHVEDKKKIAFTAIINVAQTEIHTPWITQLFDSQGRLHEITMLPGDILIYESAKLLLGRVKPLDGIKYVELVFHYTLQFDRYWYEKINSKTDPLPLGEIVNCSNTISYLNTNNNTTNTTNTNNNNNELEIIEGEDGYPTVICTEVLTNNQVELPFLSPSRTIISSGNDLYNYWLNSYQQKELSKNESIVEEYVDVEIN